MRIRYGRYCLKFFDSLPGDSPESAYSIMARMLCDPDRWFNPHGFRGWSHFGPAGSVEELAFKMAALGGGEAGRGE